MQLKHKYFLQSLILLMGVLLVGGISIWNLMSFRSAAKAAAAEYDAMDRSEAAVVQLAWLRDALRGADAATYRNLQYFRPIQNQITEIVRDLRLSVGVEDGEGPAELNRGQAAIEHLDFAVREFREMKMQSSLEQALRHRELLKA